MIYFDHAATTPVDERVLQEMLPFFEKDFGNPSSLHSYGQKALAAVDKARERVATFLNCSFGEVVFTSGATEANNLALRGLFMASVKTGGHIVSSEIEHPAVLETLKFLEKQGVEVTYVKPNEDGIVEVEKIASEIKENTRLVSVMFVNNEVGSIAPISKIGDMVRKINLTRNDENKIYFHTDAVQAAGHLDINVEELLVDLLSISGHKIYGPKGTGVLYVKNGIPLKPIQFGGHQEGGKRPGTLATPLIVGLGKAVEVVKENNQGIGGLKDKLYESLKKSISDIQINGKDKTVEHILNITIKGVEGEALLLGLDMEGIAVSTGSACSSGSLEPSHVLMSMGLSHEESHGSLRISLGKDNSQSDMDKLIEKLPPLVERFRKMAPEY